MSSPLLHRGRGRRSHVARGVSLLAALPFLIACTQEPPPATEGSLIEESGGSEVARGGTTRADLEARVAPTPPPQVDPPEVSESPGASALTVSRGTAEEAEDGRGGKASGDVVFFDLDGNLFPARALDPVLTVGELRLTQYTHPSPFVLRFTLGAEASDTARGQVVSLQYGDEAPTVLTQALVLP